MVAPVDVLRVISELRSSVRLSLVANLHLQVHPCLIRLEVFPYAERQMLTVRFTFVLELIVVSTSQIRLLQSVHDAQGNSSACYNILRGPECQVCVF